MGLLFFYLHKFVCKILLPPTPSKQQDSMYLYGVFTYMNGRSFTVNVQENKPYMDPKWAMG